MIPLNLGGGVGGGLATISGLATFGGSLCLGFISGHRFLTCTFRSHSFKRSLLSEVYSIKVIIILLHQFFYEDQARIA